MITRTDHKPRTSLTVTPAYTVHTAYIARPYIIALLLSIKKSILKLINDHDDFTTHKTDLILHIPIQPTNNRNTHTHTYAYTHTYTHIYIQNLKTQFHSLLLVFIHSFQSARDRDFDNKAAQLLTCIPPPPCPPPGPPQKNAISLKYATKNTTHTTYSNKLCIPRTFFNVSIPVNLTPEQSKSSATHPFPAIQTKVPVVRPLSNRENWMGIALRG